MNAIELLEQDHQKVRKLLGELANTTNRATKKRQDLLEKVSKELRIHTTLEEEIFYPCLKEAGKNSEDEKMYFEALEEHRAAEELVLPDLEATDPSSAEFAGRAKVLKELIEHHASEEEKEMFPRMRKLIDKETLDQLGQRMSERKKDLQASLKAA